MSSLVALLNKYGSDMGLVDKINAVVKKQNLYNHRNLRRYLERHIKLKCDVVQAYIEEFHEYMYERDAAKIFWLKYGTNIVHCDLLDEDGMTLPAVIFHNGDRIWRKDGKIHRADRDETGKLLPAVIRANGTMEWYINGKHFRDDFDESGQALPAYDDPNGYKKWYDDNDNYHVPLCRSDTSLQHDAAALIHVNGTKKWYNHGFKHRAELKRGFTRRFALPAITGPNRPNGYYFNGESYTPNGLTEKLISMEIESIIKDFGIVRENGILKITRGIKDIQITGNDKIEEVHITSFI